MSTNHQATASSSTRAIPDRQESRLVRFCIRLLLIVVAVLMVHRIILDIPSYFPRVLGHLPDGELLRKGPVKPRTRLTDLDPIPVEDAEPPAGLVRSFLDEPTVLTEIAPPSDPSTLPRIATVQLGRSGEAVHLMPCVVVPAGGSLAYDVQVPEGALFTTSVAAWFPSENRMGQLRFRLDVLSEGRSERLLDEIAPAFSPEAETAASRFLLALETKLAGGIRPERWLYRWIERDLGAYAGRRVILRLSVADNGPSAPGLGLWGLPTIYAARTEEQLNWLLLEVEGLSPHFTDCHEDRPWVETPALSRLCAGGRTARRVYAASNNPHAGMAAIAYGLQPSELSLPSDEGPPSDRVREMRAGGPPSLFRALRETGYVTAGIHNNAFAVETHPAGFDLGIDENYILGGDPRDTPNIFRLAANWMRTHRGAPFALYVQIKPTKDIFQIPPAYDLLYTLLETPSAIKLAYRYAAAAHYADRVIGWFDRLFREEGLDGRTIFTVMSGSGNVFSREKQAEYYVEGGGSRAWREAYGRHGYSTFEDELQALWVSRDPSRPAPTVSSFSSLLELRDEVSMTLGIAVARNQGTSGPRCARVEMPLGDATLCDDGLKYLQYREGVRRRWRGREEALSREVWRLQEGTTEVPYEATPELLQRLDHRRTTLLSEQPLGWVLRFPPSSDFAGAIHLSVPIRRVASDSPRGCFVMSTSTQEIEWAAKTGRSWCEFYLEPFEGEISLRGTSGKKALRGIALGLLGIDADPTKQPISPTADLPVLLALRGLPSTFPTDTPVLFATERNTWVVSEPE